jgi:hypothetical protein
MTFEEIPIRMMQLGVDRAWLAAQTDYKLPHIGNILAPNGAPKNKTDKALRRIWEALDREEERQQKPAVSMERQQLVLRPTDAEYNLWNRAANKAGETMLDWTVRTLTQQAAAATGEAPLEKTKSSA